MASQVTAQSMPLQLDIYPSIAYRHPRGETWRLMLQGRLTRQAPPSIGKRWLLHQLLRSLKANQRDIDQQCFQERIGPFLRKGESGQRIFLRIGSHTHRLKRRTRSNGLFASKIDLPASILPFPSEEAGHRHPPITIECSLEEDAITAPGKIFLIPPRGTSIVTDIDDTIKDTRVTDRKELLAQTFLRPFKPIEGMASLYRMWSDQGALFHYVSSSPWQLFQPLETFLEASQFPSGSMHLRWFQLRDEIFKRWRLLRRKSKGGIIAGMIDRMPQRKFVLIGDSGERDPEIYAKLASKFPYQVRHVLIRDLPQRPMEGERLRRVLLRCQPVPVKLFRHPEEIAKILSPEDDRSF
jgi:phosphatidate phosphatase APP1